MRAVATELHGCNGGCGDKLRPWFSMYGSCGVRYFHVDDDFMYGTESEVYDGVCGCIRSEQLVEQQHRCREQPGWPASRLDQRLLLGQMEPVLQQHVRHLRQPLERLATNAG